MSGFLHQLAVRSLGQAPEIRPRAALPFATLPEEAMAGAPEPYVPHSTPPRTSAPDPLPAMPEPGAHRPAQLLAGKGTSAWPDAPRPDLGPRPAPAQGELPRASTPAIAPVEQPARQLAVSPSAPVSGQTSPALVIRTPARREAAPASDHPADISPAPGESARPGADPSSIDLESLIARLVRPDSMAAKAPDTAAGTLADPTPVARQRPHADNPIRPSPGREASPASTEAAPEVRITIGRLEVNPPPRPTPAPAPRPRGPAPLSLSDYLARRNGGRP